VNNEITQKYSIGPSRSRRSAVAGWMADEDQFISGY